MQRNSCAIRSLSIALLGLGLCGVLAQSPSRAASFAAVPITSTSTDEGSYIPDLPRDAMSEEQENTLWHDIFEKAQQLRAQKLHDISDLASIKFGK